MVNLLKGKPPLMTPSNGQNCFIYPGFCSRLGETCTLVGGFCFKLGMLRGLAICRPCGLNGLMLIGLIGSIGVLRIGFRLTELIVESPEGQIWIEVIADGSCCIKYIASSPCELLHEVIILIW